VLFFKHPILLRSTQALEMQQTVRNKTSIFFVFLHEMKSKVEAMTFLTLFHFFGGSLAVAAQLLKPLCILDDIPISSPQ
jgi:hypothetical protein